MRVTNGDFFVKQYQLFYILTKYDTYYLTWDLLRSWFSFLFPELPWTCSVWSLRSHVNPLPLDICQTLRFNQRQSRNAVSCVCTESMVLRELTTAFIHHRHTVSFASEPCYVNNNWELFVSRFACFVFASCPLLSSGHFVQSTDWKHQQRSTASFLYQTFFLSMYMNLWSYISVTHTLIYKLIYYYYSGLVLAGENFSTCRIHDIWLLNICKAFTKAPS